jgi:uncharacterized hydrophobic protein (TIGR00271 family)
MNSSLYRMFSLRRDQQDADVIDEALRNGAQAAGTNLWVLFFAILIASVGLNVNSTAVIIGAMLISPLMGPIVGMGYGAAVADFGLIRTAFKNLALFTALSLATSVLYFTLSPLDHPGSELLARTSPTLWDVLIAAFGGAAGMVAVTRKSFSNIVPGVAIATALMPPLCTVGFGIANGRWDMSAGALYLFLINGVFIAASTLAVARLLRLPARGETDEATRSRHRLIIALGLTAVLVPSVWLGYRFVQQEVFSNAASAAGRILLSDSRVLAFDVDAPRRTLQLTTVGERDLEPLRKQALALLAREGAKRAEVTVRRAGDDPLDVLALRKDLGEELQRTLVAQVRQTDAKVLELEQKLAAASSAAAPASSPAAALPGGVSRAVPDTGRLADEIRAQLPQVQAAYLAQPLDASGYLPGTPAIVVVDVPRALNSADRLRLSRWLAVRLSRDEVTVVDRITRGSARR